MTRNARRLVPMARAATLVMACAVAFVMAAALVMAAPPSDDRDRFDRLALARIRHPPLGLPAVPIPAGSPPTLAALRLGRKLFLDRRLSRNGTLSCAMCHVPEQGWSVNEVRTAVGFEGRSLRRSAPTLLNVAYAAPFFDDGREPRLEMQPFDVFTNADEMAMPSLGALIEKIRSLPDYGPLFRQAFGAPPGVPTIGGSIATYLRSLLAANSPFDRFRFGGEKAALGPPARHGLELFTGKAHCASCHAIGEDGALFTDHRFHDTGIAWYAATQGRKNEAPIEVQLAPGVATMLPRSAIDSVGELLPFDLGRYEVTGEPDDRYRFKTPTLRNIALTAPYMHDGSIPTLRDVVAFYNQGTHPHEGLDPLLRTLGLNEEEIADLVSFLDSLTGAGVDELVRDARSEMVGNPSAGR